MLNETVDTAMKIITKLMKGENIDEYENEDLLEMYELNSEVSANVDELLEYFDCSAYQGISRGLYISPSIDNNIFGFSNEDLKRELKVANISEIYMCYFIMSTIVTMFFKDDSGVPAREYLGIKEVEEEISNRISIFKDGLNNNTISKEILENEEGCQKLIHIWNDDLPFTSAQNVERDINKQTQGRSKISFINRVFGFMEKQGLTKYVEAVNTHHYTPRLRTVIYQAYKDSRYLTTLNELFISFSELNENKEEEDVTNN